MKYGSCSKIKISVTLRFIRISLVGEVRNFTKIKTEFTCANYVIQDHNLHNNSEILRKDHHEINLLEPVQIDLPKNTVCLMFKKTKAILA